MTAKHIDLINLKLCEEWNPEQIFGWLKLNNAINISHETIYQHICRDKQHCVVLFKELLRIGRAIRSESRHSKLNDRPRKKPDHKTPAQLMTEHMVAIAA
jgi:IS30 family transposase